jgi:hypothetical protein
MDFALVVGIYVMGMASGGVIMFAMVSDRLQPRETETYSPHEDLEQRTRRVQ